MDFKEYIGRRVTAIHYPTVSEYFEKYEIINEDDKYILIGSNRIEKREALSIKEENNMFLIEAGYHYCVLLNIYSA